jgi:hypothetical protein
VTPDPSSGQGSGHTRGLIGAYTYLGTLFAFDPFLRQRLKARGLGKQTLSKTGRTAKNPCPSRYGAFALQHDQSLFRPHLKLCILSVETDWTASTFLLTLAMTRGWASLGGRYKYLILMNTFAADPFLH